ncbi:MAG: cyclodeaminase/cyclohydrolase family protein [Steroidobacteraceae bacterium]|jgi:formiminotetrahydrofolate cyclodeaminase
MTENSIEQFLDDLASGNPTPGGGSAAAIMGAMGAALVSMVCNVSFGKKGCEAAEPELRNMLVKSEELRRRLTAMVAEDIAAFDSLMAAYKLPKSSDEEKARRTETIQACLERATEVPLACARASAHAVQMARRAADLGYKHVISDVGVGVAAADAALRSAALNVYINAPSLKDRRFAASAIEEVERLAADSALDSEATYAAVRIKLES